MARIVHLAASSNWFYYQPGASTPADVKRIAAWATFEDGTTTALVAATGDAEHGASPRLESVDRTVPGVFSHFADLPDNLKPGRRGLSTPPHTTK